VDVSRIKLRFETVSPHLDERMRRIIAASETLGEGYGAISEVSRATGVSRRAISQGVQELKQGVPEPQRKGRIRREGGGRKKAVDVDSTLRSDLEQLIEPATRGDPESPLLWTCKSLRSLSEELKAKGHATNRQTVAELLHEMGYSLQANKKTVEGSTSPDRNEQFEYIYHTTNEFHNAGEPVISVDTKKKELVGNFKNNGCEWQPKGMPTKVNVHDFPDKELGKAIPYGIYDLIQNEGWVNVGIDHDTAAFAVASIQGWWDSMGRSRYPEAKNLMITADSGGSNGYRRRLWKAQLQKFADSAGLAVHVAHLPPGTSKWNKIEHRLFSFISQNWRGRPLISHEVIVNLIASTRTGKGLKVYCQLDSNTYAKGVKVTDEEMASLNIKHSNFRGEWNYTIYPRKEDDSVVH
jgi:transposase